MVLENNNTTTGGAKCFPAAWNAAAKPCDSCKSASAVLFCRKDMVFLCMACDVKLHRHTKHERVWMCEVCEQSPASVMCKADAATLCVSCDRDIHSANPLARRHERIPVVPFYNSAEAVVNSTAGSFLDTVSDYGTAVLNNSVPKEDHDSWAIPSDSTNISVDFASDASPVVMKSLDLLSASDRLFDFGFAIPTFVRLETQLHDPINDGVVPVETTVPTKNFPITPIDDHKSPAPRTRYEIDFTRCITNSYDKSNSQSHSHSVSSSSMDAGVVPEENSLLDVSNPLMLPVSGGGMYCSKKAKQFCAVDREARVLRYREKRKNRKFEKKIRYASRKAYAEMRPRIKGRFAKRTDSTTATELDVDRWLFTAENNTHSYGAEVEYGVVPSF